MNFDNTAAPAPATMKIADADMESGFRIINVADKTDADKEYVAPVVKEPAAKK